MENFEKQQQDINFRPISKGLGFHNKEQRTPGYSQISVQSPYANRHHGKQAKAVDDVFGYTDLEAFYSPRVKQEQSLEKLSPKTFEKSATTKLVFDSRDNIGNSELALKRFLAWLIDLTIVVLFTFMSLALLAMLNNLNEYIYTLAPSATTFLWLIIPFFMINYLIYFTLMEKVFMTSAGKKLFHLKISSQLNLNQALYRSCITMLSFVTLGVPALFDFQGKLTDSKIILSHD